MVEQTCSPHTKFSMLVLHKLVWIKMWILFINWSQNNNQRNSINSCWPNTLFLLSKILFTEAKLLNKITRQLLLLIFYECLNKHKQNTLHIIQLFTSAHEQAVICLENKKAVLSQTWPHDALLLCNTMQYRYDPAIKVWSSDVNKGAWQMPCRNYGLRPGPPLVSP